MLKQLITILSTQECHSFKMKKKDLMQIRNNFWIILFDFVVTKLFYSMKFS